ncbi:hypothetical protein [Streptomyces sp. NPDC052610]|uniref:hypothetical protein n=1 Tax=Streptomyces sp. NPDC052610 TaxID=3154952 RepID=UPI00342A6472
MDTPGRDDETWFFPFGLDGETRRLLRGSRQRPWFPRRGLFRRNRQEGLENRLRLARLGVTSTGHIPGDQAGALAVRLLEEGTGLPDEDHTDRVRHAGRILDELRTLAEPATRG